MKPEILIRADGSPRIGLGHLVRCSALAHMLKENFKITFVCREIPDTMIAELDGSGFNCRKIENEDEFFSQLNNNAIAVLDGYPFTANYQKQVKTTGAKLVFIDDLHDKEFFADLIINHAPGIIPRDYKAQPFTQFALGLEYALLRPAFLEQARLHREIRKIETLFICFGGSDLKNLTKNTLDAALEFPEFKKILLVTGLSYQVAEEIDLLIKNDQRIDHRHALNENQMLAAMLEADLAVVPASGILFEVLAAGCIAISGWYADNQKFVYENARNNGLFVDAGNFSSEKLNNAIHVALEGQNYKAKSIDGQSDTRISKLFDLLAKESFIKARRAGPEDLDLTFNWASSHEVRRYSFQQHQISKTEHTNWFNNKTRDIGCIYFIMEYNGEPIGSIRFDINEGVALISYLLDPNHHGKGFGMIILKKGIECLLELKNSEIISIRTICGLVMKTNLPSIKSFERLRFSKTEERDCYKFEILI